MNANGEDGQQQGGDQDKIIQNFILDKLQEGEGDNGGDRPSEHVD